MKNINIDELPKLIESIENFLKLEFESPGIYLNELGFFINQISASTMVSFVSNLSKYDVPIKSILINKLKQFEPFSNYNWSLINGCIFRLEAYSSLSGLGSLFFINLKNKTYFIHNVEFRQYDDYYKATTEKYREVEDRSQIKYSELEKKLLGENIDGEAYFKIRKDVFDMKHLVEKNGYIYSEE